MTESPSDPQAHVVPSRTLVVRASHQERQKPMSANAGREACHTAAPHHHHQHQHQQHGPRTPLLLRETAPLGSLPYLDDDAALSAVRPIVEAMVAEEAANGARRPAAYLDMLPPQLQSMTMTVGLSRAVGEPQVAVAPPDNADAAAPPAAAAAAAVDDACAPLSIPRAPPSGRHASSMSAWRSAVHKTNATLEHATATLLNSQLLTRYGGSVWKLANQDLETALRRTREEVRAVKTSIAQLNRRRKSEQLRIGRDIGKASREYRRLVDKNRAIGLALLRGSR
jgi:hypothetical protein